MADTKNVGRVIWITGLSGAGKTTLLRCINFLSPSDGVVNALDRAYLQNKWVDANVATAAVGGTNLGTLAFEGNAAVDFDGAPVVIENLVGGGAITGGTGYTITGSITIEVGEDGAIVPFVFDGPVTIGEGVVLNIVGAANLPKEKVVFLSVSNGAISGKIASVAADDGKAATASKSSGTSYCVNKGKPGLTVVIR